MTAQEAAKKLAIFARRQKEEEELPPPPPPPKSGFKAFLDELPTALGLIALLAVSVYSGKFAIETASGFNSGNQAGACCCMSGEKGVMSSPDFF